MKKGKFIIFILVIALLSFSLISCGKQAVTTTTAKVAEVTTTTVQPTTTVKATTTTEKATTTIEATTTTINREEADNAVKETAKDFIENIFGGRLTKIIVADDISNITMSYDTKWSSEDRVKKEMFDVTTIFTGATTILFDLDLSATTQGGDTFHAFTSNDNLYKIKDVEMSYEDWLKVAIK